PQPLVRQEAPRQKAAGVARVAVQESPMIMGKRAKLAALYQLAGILDDRRPAIVIANQRQYARLSCRHITLNGIFGEAAHGLFTENVLLLSRRRADHLKVHAVWRGDVHCLNVWMANYLVPVCREPRKAEALLGLTSTRLDRIRADHQTGLNSTIVE